MFSCCRLWSLFMGVGTLVNVLIVILYVLDVCSFVCLAVCISPQLLDSMRNRQGGRFSGSLVRLFLVKFSVYSRALEYILAV